MNFASAASDADSKDTSNLQLHALIMPTYLYKLYWRCLIVHKGGTHIQELRNETQKTLQDCC